MVLRVKIKSATLVETLVAVSILSIVSALAIMIFLAVSRPSSNSSSLILAQQKSAEIMDQMNNELLSEAFPYETKIQNLTFYVSYFDYDKSLKQVDVEVKDVEEELIYTRKQVFYWYE